MSEVIELVDEFEDKEFQIRNDRDAEYALKRIRETQAEVDKFREYYDEQIRKMQERADGIRGYYTAHLHAYFDNVPHKVSKTQESYELPSAKLVFKQQNPEYVRDEDVVLEWLKKAGETQFVRTKEILDWAELKKKIEVSGNDCIVKDTGEVVPGISVQYREPKFDVSFKKEG